MPRSILTPAEYQSLLTGLPKYCPNAVFAIGGQSYTVTQAAALITSIVEAGTAIPVARANLLAAIAEFARAQTVDGEIVKGIRAIVALDLKNDLPALADLSIVPRKAPRALTVEERLTATAKAKATRKARGTMSKKQKAKITGDVTGVTIVPVTNEESAP